MSGKSISTGAETQPPVRIWRRGHEEWSLSNVQGSGGKRLAVS